MPSGVARLLSAVPAGLGTMQYLLGPLSRWLFRWRGVTVSPDGSRIVIRASLRCPTTELGLAHGGRWPSKRTSFRASPFVTYTFPETGLTAMSKRTVPTPEKGW